MKKSGSSADDSAFAEEQERLAEDRDAAATEIKQTISDAAAGRIMVRS